MFVVFIMGTAGSGKSYLTSEFDRWLKLSNQKVATVNLDPGVINLPYVPDVDVRSYIDLMNLMTAHKLGPNGAMILAADLVANKIHVLSEEISDLNADIVFVDTPGQMELFAFRESGPYITRELVGDEKAIIYLFDSVFSLNPSNYISNLFLSASVQNRFFLSHLHVLSKSDLLPKSEVEKIVKWSTHPQYLEESVNQMLKGANRLLSRNMMQAIYQLEFETVLVPVSARTNQGMLSLNVALERMLATGEKFSR